jgi:hypothetical protein
MLMVGKRSGIISMSSFNAVHSFYLDSKEYEFEIRRLSRQSIRNGLSMLNNSVEHQESLCLKTSNRVVILNIHFASTAQEHIRRKVNCQR